MSFIGNVPAEAYSPVVKDTFSGNGSTTDFTLSIPATTNSVEVFVENVQQEPTTAYTISGTTLSFTAAPTTGTNNIYVIHRGPAVQTVVPPAGVALNPSTVTATGDISTDTGVNTDTISEKTSASGVTIDGVLLKDNDIEATDGTFSGGVYLGGTGAANYLDDYEEGTFTPTVSAGLESITYATQSGHYTKTGNFVFFVIRMTVTSSTRNASQLNIGSLPFTAKSGIPGQAGSAYWAYVASVVQSSTTTNPPQLYINNGTTQITFYSGAGNFVGNNLESAIPDFYITGHYLTA